MHELQRRREEADLSRAALGRLAQCTGQMVGQIERGETKPGPLLAVRLAEALKAPVLDLFPELAPVIQAVKGS